MTRYHVITGKYSNGKPQSHQLQGQTMNRQIVLLLSLIVFTLLYLFSTYRSTLSIENLWAEEQVAREYAAVTTKGGTTTASKKDETSRLEIPIEKLRDSILKARQEFDDRMKELYGEAFFPVIFHRIDEAFEFNTISKQRFLRRLQIKLLRSLLYPSFGESFMWITAGHSNAAAHGNFYNQSYTAVAERYVRDAFQSVGMDVLAKNYAMGGYPSGVELSLCLESVYGQHFDLFSWDFGMTDSRIYFRLELMLNRIVTAANAWSVSSSENHSYFPMVLLRAPDGQRRNIMKHVEQLGLGSIVMKGQSPILQDLKEKVPDAALLDVNFQGNLTAHLAYFVCNGAFEANDPCGKRDFKFRTSPCKQADGQVKWHDGWKMQHLNGVILADYLIQMLQEAVEQFGSLLQPGTSGTKSDTPLSTSSSDRKNSHDIIDSLRLLSSLQEQERADRLKFISTSANVTLTTSSFGSLGEVAERVGLAALARKTSLCHTALLPSQARYDGIVTESGNKRNYLEDFDVGHSKTSILKKSGASSPESTVHSSITNANGTYSNPHSMPLVFDPRDYQSCETLLEVDHKDFFFVQGGIGWVSITIPNNAEIAAYSPRQATQVPSGDKTMKEGEFSSSGTFLAARNADATDTEREGIIIICTRLCAFGKCPKDNIDLSKDLRQPGQNTTDSSKSLTIEVDGKPVIKTVKFHYCDVLQGPHGSLKWGSGNENGQYVLKFKVDDTNKHIHISSFIVL